MKTLLLLLCVLTAIGAAGAPDARAATNATVISESLPVYSQMSSSSKVAKSLKKGDRVSVDIEIDAGEAWCSVSGIGGGTGSLYGGIRDLPTTFLIGRDGRIYLRLPGAVPASAFESRIKTLLAAN